MSKDLKAIQCPKCGSTFKQEFKPDFYQCKNCGTEYYLDSDDTHIYHHHERMPPMPSSAPPVNSKTPLFILIGVIAFFSIVYLITMLIQPKRNADQVYTKYKPLRSYYSSFVYCNSSTGNPVYLRMGVDYIDKGDYKSEQELHAQFNNAMDGKLLKDQMITEDNLRKNRCSLSFKIYSAELIYAIGCNSILLQLDTRNNRLSDVTKGTFEQYPQLSSGVAKLDFDYRKPMITVMNNEGETFYYFPAVRKLAKNEAEAEEVGKQISNTKRYFEFGYMGDFFDDHKKDQLLEIKYDKSSDRSLKRDITPGRKYFSPAIIYQDENNLIIVVNTTAAPAPPMSIQKIDIATGKILWALPPDKFYLSQVVKCRQGYAIEYRKDEDADYVHGVMVVSDAGKLVRDYQLSRTE
jgi:hypothetical protein